MKTPPQSPRDCSDAELIEAVKRLAAGERQATAELLRCLMEFDTRRLYLGEGYPSLFAYCTQALHYAEHAALNRIEVARAAKQWPILLDHIASGALHLSGARLLAPHLAHENVEPLLAAGCHKSRREIEEIVARLRPKPDVPSMVRKLPAKGAPSPPSVLVPGDTCVTDSLSPTPATIAPAQPTVQLAPPRAVIAPLAPERYKVQFTINGKTRDQLKEVQDLLRHTIPDGDLAAIFERALGTLLDHLRRTRFAATQRPRAARSHDPSSRHIPAVVKREVWKRDGGRCAFVGSGRRCEERGFVEFHHVVPYAAGGATTVKNIELRCRAHNVYEAVLFFGCEEQGELHD